MKVVSGRKQRTAFQAVFAGGLALAAWTAHIYDQTLVGAWGFLGVALLSGVLGGFLSRGEDVAGSLRVIFFASALGSPLCFAILGANYYVAAGSSTEARVPIDQHTTRGRKQKDAIAVTLMGHRKLLNERGDGCADDAHLTAVVTLQEGLLGLPIIRAHRCE